MASAFEIVGHLRPSREREWLRQRPGSWTGDALESSHVCPYCGSPTECDDSQARPFDVTCERCLATLAEIARRIEECLQSLRDLEAGRTDFFKVPFRPAWPKRREA